ncbi:MAG TPA: tRNA pseudouridine(13) synthase TruD [Candidatus Nanoarchaeia archaeon]|nr:tRNA pseudouridine(13) synthase TruD [Candidatus Nanoarchaeia archaeon]
MLNKSKSCKNIGIDSKFLIKGNIRGELYLKHNDFFVEEIHYAKNIKNINDIKSNPYIILELTKKGISTFEAIDLLLNKLKILRNKISYCGLKDTNGLTKQWISIENNSRVQHLITNFNDKKNRHKAIGLFEN